MEQDKHTLVDAAYGERDAVVALAAKLAIEAGYQAWIGPVSDPEPGWTRAVYIDLPTGQVSWHIKDAEIVWFETLEECDTPWDGHATHEKYQRVWSFCNPHLAE